MEILDINAVVVLNGMPKSPMTPKLLAAVIIIGTVPVNPATTFLNMKLNNMIKASGQGRKQPIREKAILIAPPESRHKDRFRSHLAEIIHIPDADLGPLDTFIKKIKTND